MATPSKPLKDWLAEYQRTNPYSPDAFNRLFTEAQKAGYNVARTTHANNTLASNDALVDSSGAVYDLVFNSDNAPGAGTPNWTLNPAGSYDPNRAIVGPDGKFIKYSDWAKQYQSGGSGTPPADTGQPASGTSQSQTVLGQGAPSGAASGAAAWAAMRFGKKTGDRIAANLATARGSSSPGAPPSPGNPYEAAAAAAARSRMTAQRGGRRSTILGGFGSGAPSTRPATVLGY